MRLLLLGLIVGGATLWLWRDQVREGLATTRRVARQRAAGALEVAEDAAADVLDRTRQQLQQAEEVLDRARDRIGPGRAAQERIRLRPGGRP